MTRFDVVGIDPDEAGERVTDLLESAGTTLVWVIAALWVVALVAAIVVSHKAGYSRWWGVVGVLIPPLGVVLLAVAAVVTWPVHRQRNEARAVVAEHHLVLPSQARQAERQAQQARRTEEAAREAMDRARQQRELADAEHARIQALQVAAQEQHSKDQASAEEPGEANGKPAAVRAAADAPTPDAPAPDAPASEVPTSDKPAG